ncbi:putative addiction module killer protein [Sphingomonas jejuensis]|uniref:Addiction module killer protein n=1 Tax=Sphingomonas jejuensis TaxID=904715 RepID=A0ABX0XKW8_9SPHN|nr:type II toxin-antitoxin system RelE/ParE family toxin [Sphingomonas jejuensis]NJC33885.1 putative addiction module killer protein [Sphingomonas jejuensis]
MQVIETSVFTDWLNGLRDVVGRRAIVRRIARIAATGNFGDAEPLGDDVAELRFHLGPGYRVYFTMLDGTVILCGGNKSTQARDIRKAKEMAAELRK